MFLLTAAFSTTSFLENMHLGLSSRWHISGSSLHFQSLSLRLQCEHTTPSPFRCTNPAAASLRLHTSPFQDENVSRRLASSFTKNFLRMRGHVRLSLKWSVSGSDGASQPETSSPQNAHLAISGSCTNTNPASAILVFSTHPFHFLLKVFRRSSIYFKTKRF
uniref:Uncharacterized protein n=1 Tax=Diadromus pulchellus ascovirus 4a TaxID=158683 RepID=Q9DSW7_9VIRU|nr:hypothetical protein [Diadromus pulchellus ascovirus 4a]